MKPSTLWFWKLLLGGLACFTVFVYTIKYSFKWFCDMMLHLS